jgi:hypothetical protein
VKIEIKEAQDLEHQLSVVKRSEEATCKMNQRETNRNIKERKTMKVFANHSNLLSPTVFLTDVAFSLNDEVLHGPSAKDPTPPRHKFEQENGPRKRVSGTTYISAKRSHAERRVMQPASRASRWRFKGA